MTDIISYNEEYHPDIATDKLFVREKGRLVYYKNGTEDFLSDKSFWHNYL